MTEFPISRHLEKQRWVPSAVDGGTLVRHTIVGEAVGEYEAIWRDRIEPSHDLILEAILDHIEAAGQHRMLGRRQSR